MDARDDERRPADLEWSERSEGARAEFTVAPSRMHALPLLVGAGIWDSFLVFFVIAVKRDPSPAHPSLIVVPIAHALIGLYVTWLALVKALNRSRLTIDRDSLVVSQSPVPAAGARFATRDIESFDIWNADRSGEATAPGRWRVRVITRDGRTKTVPLPLDDRADIGFVASRLRAALIETRATAG